MTEPRTEAGLKFRDYLRDSFVHEADDTEPLDMTHRILAIEAQAAASLDEEILARAINAVGPGTATWSEVHATATEYARVLADLTASSRPMTEPRIVDHCRNLLQGTDYIVVMPPKDAL